MSWAKLILFILFLRWACFELYSIPSGSMEPILHGDPRFLRGDRVAVNKALFGPRIPFTTVRLFPLGEPKRWDIVVFNAVDPDAPHPILIKRVVGLPGERVHIRGGQVYVNGDPVTPPESLRETLYYTTQIAPPRNVVRDELLRLAKHVTDTSEMNLDVYGMDILAADLERLHHRLADVDLDRLTEAERQNLTADVRPVTYQIIGEFKAREENKSTPFKYGIRSSEQYSVVPKGHYFLLGDNSGNSGDGRVFGWVPHKNLYGRAFAIVWPFDRMRDLTGFTGTWWGKLLLLGLPGLLIAYELFRAFIGVSWRVPRPVESLGLRPGDRVWINRAAFGVRLPLIGRSIGAKWPSTGAWVAYVAPGPGEEGAYLYFGQVLQSGPRRVLLETPAEPERTRREVTRPEIVGSASRVWWPPGRRRRLAAATSESAPETDEG